MADDDLAKPARDMPTDAGATTWKDLLTSDKITPEHVTMVLDTVAKVVEARAKAGLIQAATDQRIRVMMAELRTDTARAEQSVEIFEALQQYLDPETRSRVAAEVIPLIIKKQLGVE
ncbi:MAG: hypothetical protein M5T61_20890 [Acidimicrobiia bacterium]|nr:hypothetical protein [Acidimicrobiia bacterium]